MTEDEHSVLIYCPLKTSVNTFASVIMDLHKRGALQSVLTVPVEQLEFAKTLGSEWLGNEHPIVQCLNIGVAVHHGGLPTPFRKEMEKLLRDGALKVTISSPTLAQGLNLSATAVVIYSLWRNGNLIEASEFKNVIGRAGRAFVDTHGLVLYPIYEDHAKQKGLWRGLVEDTNAREMESGLAMLVYSLITRIAASSGKNEFSDIQEYILNNNQSLEFPLVVNEPSSDTEEQRKEWNINIVRLDTALLSMLGEEDVNDATIPSVLDSVLQSSLWQRRLRRHEEDVQGTFSSILEIRAKHIWSSSTPLQRKGYFLAGVGLETGQKLDLIAPNANKLLVKANAYILKNIQDEAIETITALAELVFEISPFSPLTFPDDWRHILEVWLKGEAFSDHEFDSIDDALKFVEDGLIYRLPWGLEAVRVRAKANEDEINETFDIEGYMIVQGGVIDDQYELGLIVPAIESGTLNRSAAMLMQAGFGSRSEAISAIQSTGGTFSNSREFKEWLSSDAIKAYVAALNLISENTAKLWKMFLKEYQPKSNTVWEGTSTNLPVNWEPGVNAQIGQLIKLHNEDADVTKVLSSDGEVIGKLRERYELLKNGVYRTQVEANNFLQVTYWGTGENPFQAS
ncbi:hypothetical protein CJF42_14355 [Pseudoalteromonas sp. NBT06-2]|uniref:helicase-related protein n=1 Tax=Pseudoalteromonas sp. NBT06-2 TaxID=2025950 RepID=UPI000BA64EB8|nr:helicase-related protein [Pseudoalteromonas sp. NBT06-2]PAJ73674.1 hypothetical protein CJF42_14355 [Pseudoalteromonas sp. NBT06-2]